MDDYDLLVLEFIRSVFECVSDRVCLEIDQDNEFACKINKAITEVSALTGTSLEVSDWWLVPAEFAEHARQLAEIVVDTRLGLLWGQTVPTVFMPLFPPEMLEILDNKNAQ